MVVVPNNVVNRLELSRNIYIICGDQQLSLSLKDYFSIPDKSKKEFKS